MFPMILQAILLSAIVFDVVTCGCVPSKKAVVSFGMPDQIVPVRVEHNGVFQRYCTGAMFEPDIVLIGHFGACNIIGGNGITAFVEINNNGRAQPIQINDFEAASERFVVGKLVTAVAGLPTGFTLGEEVAPPVGMAGAYEGETGDPVVIPTARFELEHVPHDFLVNSAAGYGSVYHRSNGQCLVIYGVCMETVPMRHPIGTESLLCTNVQPHRDAIRNAINILSTRANNG